MGTTFINVSDVIEYLFCPRFIYFIYCLGIPQHEEKRYKVIKGRELHELKKKFNKNYLRKKLNCIRKEDAVYLSSEKYHIKGEKFKEKDFEKATEIINEILNIVQKGLYPKKTSYKMRCVDCCYRRICV